jgi:hypothetical protein
MRQEFRVVRDQVMQSSLTIQTDTSAVWSYAIGTKFPMDDNAENRLSTACGKGWLDTMPCLLLVSLQCRGEVL